LAHADKKLFTPGPLTTSPSVKQAMTRDLGSRDSEFIALVHSIREDLLRLAAVSPADYAAILLQGSGTYAVEAVFASLTPPNGKWLLLVNGAYGRRMMQIAETWNLPATPLIFAEDEAVSPSALKAALDADSQISHVAVVHCETTSGIFNPVEALGALAKAQGKVFFVDAMSSFGAVPLNFEQAGVDVLVSSANKCIEGVPGFAFALVRRAVLESATWKPRSVTLDLVGQWRGLEANGQFRFTPPTHTLLAFRQALDELEQEGGVAGRAERYRANHLTILDGMSALGFQPYLGPAHRGYIITAFHYPQHPNFSFEAFYNALNAKDCVIYPGKVTAADCFRIGHIGRLYPQDMQTLLEAIAQTLAELHINLQTLAAEV
jgi:2-aminoethylphosphonate-pyruvate transaminase